MKVTEYVGIALDTILDDVTTDLRVWIPELFPFVVGDPSKEAKVTTSIKNTCPNAKYKYDLTAVQYVVCKFHGIDISTRPNVHVGEHLKIIVIEDNTNVYYWNIIGRDSDLRTVEYRRIMLSNKPSQNDPLNPDDSYFVEIDTRPPFVDRVPKTTTTKANTILKDAIKMYATAKLTEAKAQVDMATRYAEQAEYTSIASLGSKLSDNITKAIERINKKPLGRRFKLHLGQGTKEPVGYDVIFDMENSTFTLIDTEGNYILLESLSRQIHVENGNGDFAYVYPNNIRAQIKNGDHINITPNNIRAQIITGESLDISPGITTSTTPIFYCTGRIVAANEITTLLNGGVHLSSHGHLGTNSDADINLTPPVPGGAGMPPSEPADPVKLEDL